MTTCGDVLWLKPEVLLQHFKSDGPATRRETLSAGIRGIYLYEVKARDEDRIVSYVSSAGDNPSRIAYLISSGML